MKKKDIIQERLFMLSFKNIELSDREILESFFEKFGYPVSDNCFGGLYIWQPGFQSQYAVIEETVILRGKDGGRWVYQCPIGKNVKAAAEFLINTRQPDLLFVGLCPAEKAFLERNFEGKFKFINNRDSSEYVYSREALCSFSGKNYQQKRNHVNKFLRLYGQPETVILNGENISLISETEHLWINGHDGEDIRIIHENAAFRRAVENFDELGFMGAAIRVEGKTVAFGIGEKLSEDTVIEHFEKADREMDGCYAVMVQQFARILPPEIKYINREEDMGIEGLRKSKLSLKPVFMEEKYDGIYIG